MLQVSARSWWVTFLTAGGPEVLLKKPEGAKFTDTLNQQKALTQVLSEASDSNLARYRCPGICKQVTGPNAGFH